MKAEVDINEAENRKIGSQKNQILFFWKKKIKRWTTKKFNFKRA